MVFEEEAHKSSSSSKEIYMSLFSFFGLGSQQHVLSPNCSFSVFPLVMCMQVYSAVINLPQSGERVLYKTSVHFLPFKKRPKFFSPIFTQKLPKAMFFSSVKFLHLPLPFSIFLSFQNLLWYVSEVMYSSWLLSFLVLFL